VDKKNKAAQLDLILIRGHRLLPRLDAAVLSFVAAKLIRAGYGGVPVPEQTSKGPISQGQEPRRSLGNSLCEC
jgi:hypothetical protein